MRNWSSISINVGAFVHNVKWNFGTIFSQIIISHTLVDLMERLQQQRTPGSVYNHGSPPRLC